METQLYKSIAEVLSIAKATCGHRISEYNVNGRDLSKKNKGVIGQIVEEGVFHYPVNSRAEADFADLGLELKVTGLKQLKNKDFVFKERLVLNIINYFREYEVSFESSSFWKKNENLLFILYLYEDLRDDQDFLLIDSLLHNFNEKDLLIIKQDWERIHKKIIDGKAEEISESDTFYLGACTKGANAESSYREQPCSNVKARQRAYCLKTSYLNSFLKESLLGEKCESVLSYNELLNCTFEYAFESKLKQYYKMNESTLFHRFGLEKCSAKNKYNMLIGAMLGIKGNINKTEEFLKANIELKTIRVEEDRTIKEHMSFPTYKYKELVTEEWETSTIKNMFETKKFMFVVFEKKNDEYFFSKVVFWNMPENILENQIKEVWLKTIDVIKNGDIVKRDLGSKYETNLPGPTYNKIFHTRPHDTKGIKSTGKGYELPVKDKITGLDRYTKYCFWLDKNFIAKVIK